MATKRKTPTLTDEEWISVAEELEGLAEAIRTRIDSDDAEFRGYLPYRFTGSEYTAVMAAIKASRDKVGKHAA